MSFHFAINHRHPQLVSGPISPPTRRQRRQTQSHGKIDPMRVVAFDQIDLPRPMPALELLFAQDGPFHVAELLEADKHVHRIFRGESRERIGAVPPQPRDEVGGYADVERAVRFAGENIDAGVALGRHGVERAAPWILKQVQDDEVGKMGRISRA